MAHKTIASAFVKAQQAFGPALKTSTNPHFRSKYADLAVCIEAVIDALHQNGIALMQHTHPCDDGVIVETIFLHESGEQLSAGVLHVPAPKHDPQGYGSALTYARRYSLLSAAGIATESDDDGNAASKKKQLPVYTDDQLAANVEAWTEALRDGKTTTDKIIAMISSKYTLTDNQKKTIKDMAE